jgi:hypothetical protein
MHEGVGVVIAVCEDDWQTHGDSLSFCVSSPLNTSFFFAFCRKIEKKTDRIFVGCVAIKQRHGNICLISEEQRHEEAGDDMDGCVCARYGTVGLFENTGSQGISATSTAIGKACEAREVGIEGDEKGPCCQEEGVGGICFVYEKSAEVVYRKARG